MTSGVRDEHAYALGFRPRAWSIASWIRRSPQARYLELVLTLAALYIVSARVSHIMAFAGPVSAVLWIPAGVAIAFLYLVGLRYWPGILIGDLLVNCFLRLPLGTAVGKTLGNVLGVIVAALLLEKLAARRTAVVSVVGTLAALAIGCAISATVGVLSLHLGDVASSASQKNAWRIWWLGDFCGALLVVPFAIAWSRPWRRPTRHELLEIAVVFVVLALTCALAWQARDPLTYLVFPVLIWIAFRLGPRCATLATLLTAGFAVWAATHQAVPVLSDSFSHGVLKAQLFIVTAAVTTQLFSAVVDERRMFERRLLASRARLVRATDLERRRIERNLHDGVQQRLLGVMLHLGVASNTAEASSDIHGAIETAQGDLQVAINELRALARGKDPPVLRNDGLAAAVEELARNAVVETDVLAVPARRLAGQTEAVAYYVIAEALTNAQKHAHASKITVAAELTHRGLCVCVQDNGCGGAVENEGSGLEHLRDRVEAMGGAFDLLSSVGTHPGTRVEARIPELEASREQPSAIYDDAPRH